MRKALAFLLVFALLWSIVPARFSVQYSVQAHFTDLTQSYTFTPHSVLTAEFPAPASSLALTYSTTSGDEIDFLVRYLEAGTWSDWEVLHTDEDMTREEDYKRFSERIYLPQSPSLELKVLAEGPVEFTHLEAISFETKNHIDFTLAPRRADALQDGLIITRSEWGADDKYLFAEGWNTARDELCAAKSWYCGSSEGSSDAIQKKAAAVAAAYPEDVKIEERIPSVGGKELAWAVNKSAKIRKLFVHHTAELNKDQNGDGVINRQDEEIALRGIYYYHSIVRGWGDIGYNFIVGPTGNIYEGRFGGDKVVAAHAVWRNISSIGVSAMGNFESETVGANQKAGLAKILAYLSKKYNLDPTGTSLFYGKTTDSILGHRDSDEAATACPGKDLYAQLPSLRQLTKDSMSGIDVTPTGPLGTISNAKFTSSFNPLETPAQFGPGETKSITLTLVNTGTETWDTSTFLSIVDAPKGAFRVLSGDASATKAAYLSSITPPGDTGEFKLTLQNRYAGFSGNINILPVAGGRFAMNAFPLPVTMQKGTVAFSDASATQTYTSYTFGEPIRGTVRLKNSGNVTWEKSGASSAYIEVATSSADGTLTPLPDRTELPKDVAPGGFVDVPFVVTAPLREGNFTLVFTLRINEEASLFGTPVRTAVSIVHPGEHSRLKLAFNPTATADLTTSIDAAGTYVMYVTNTSQATWENLSVLEPTLTLPTTAGLLTLEKGVFDARTLEPGKTTALRFPFQTNYVPGTFTGAFSLKIGEKDLLKPINKTVTVADKELRASLLTTSVSQKTASSTLSVKNAGAVTWRPGKVSILLAGTLRAPMNGDAAVSPGQTATFTIPTGSVTASGVQLALSLEGRIDTIDLGLLTKKVAGAIPLDFGSFLEFFPLR